MVGDICNDYIGYKKFKFIGQGGFGKVYKYPSESEPHLALKVENKVHKCIN